jgi:hypothetical protein
MVFSILILFFQLHLYIQSDHLSLDVLNLKILCAFLKFSDHLILKL